MNGIQRQCQSKIQILQNKLDESLNETENVRKVSSHKINKLTQEMDNFKTIELIRLKTECRTHLEKVEGLQCQKEKTAKDLHEKYEEKVKEHDQIVKSLQQRHKELQESVVNLYHQINDLTQERDTVKYEYQVKM